MASRKFGAILRHIQALVGMGAATGEGDARLLEQFAGSQEEAPFACLVQRHGGMVLGVCRRVLRDPQEAEDAFQATFLVLARKATSIRQPRALASWLYRVAYHISVKAKTSAAKRRAHERRAGDMATLRSPFDSTEGRPPEFPESESPERGPAAEAAGHEVQEVIDEELNRLPEKYRAPVVLCCLEGKSYGEAAEQLHWPADSLKTRLTRARELLRGRLARRGLALSAGSFALMIENCTASAAVPAPLASSTVKLASLFAAGQAASGALSSQAALLADDMLTALWVSRVRIAAAVTVILAGSLGLLAHWGLAAKPTPAPTSSLLPAEPRVAAVLQHEDVVNIVCFSPDGATLATGSRDRSVRLWDAATGRSVATQRGHTGAVQHLVFSTDGKFLASSAEGDKRIILWDVARQQQSGFLPGWQPLAFSPDGKTLGGLGIDQGVTTWDIAKDQPLAAVQLQGGQATRAHACSVAARMLATVETNGTMKLWELRFWALGLDMQRASPRLQIPQTGITCLAFSPDGSRLATGGFEDARWVKLWQPAAGKIDATLPHPGPVHCLAFSSDANILATSCADGALRLWDLRRAVQRWVLRDFPAGFASLAFAPDGKLLAAAGRLDKRVTLWHIPDP